MHGTPRSMCAAAGAVPAQPRRLALACGEVRTTAHGATAGLCGLLLHSPAKGSRIWCECGHVSRALWPICGELLRVRDDFGRCCAPLLWAWGGDMPPNAQGLPPLVGDCELFLG